MTTAFQQTSWVETLAVIFSIAYVILAAYQNIWCWLMAIISTLLYIYICFTAKLYSETGLMVFYLVMAFYGWWKWKHKNSQEETIAISSIGIKGQLPLLFYGSVLTLVFYFIMKNYTNAALPLPDAFVTGFSLVATFMVAKKNLENWFWWVVIDSLAVYIYFNRGLQLTAVLYFIYVIIAVAGFVKWRKEFLQQKT